MERGEVQQTVLVADDDESIRLLLTMLLEESGYQALAAEDGRMAVDLALEHRPDIAILDVMMPIMDGFDACRALKADRRTANMPVILLTALAQTPSKVEGLDIGASDYVTKPFESAELLARVRAALAQKNQRDRLAAEALTDALTTLTNRRGLEQQLEQLLAHTGREHEPLSLLLFDADHFKSVNDTYGHHIGDVVLAALAQRARETMRAQDVIGRFGGEEFLAILPSATAEAAVAAAERLRGYVEATPIRTPAGPVGVTVSVGVTTTVHGAEMERSALIAMADRALYAAKRTGRNRVVHADGQPTSPLSAAEPPETARALLAALSLVHTPTAEHSRLVSELCWEIGVELRLAPLDRSRVALAGLLHDIGKLAAPRALLDQTVPHEVSPDQIEQATQLLQSLPNLQVMAHMVAAQGEWWDGSGRPRGLHGPDIPLGSRIIAVADACAMIRRNLVPLNGNATNDASAEALRRGAGTRFDPAVVDAAMRVLR